MNSQQVQLGEIAQVQLGITLRGADASQHDPHGTHQLLRISDLNEDGVLSLGAPNLIKIDALAAQRYEVRAEDVLLAARGTRMTAAVFSGGGGPCVAGGQFIMIRPRPDRLRPAFLGWYLNLPEVQERLLASARGSYVRSLPVSSVNALMLPLPVLATQDAIAELRALRIREKTLMLELVAKRASLIDRTALCHLHR